MKWSSGFRFIVLCVLAALVEPWVNTTLKPHRMWVDVPYFHAAPTPISLYFANQRQQPTAFTHEQIERLHAVDSSEMPAPLVLTRAFVRSARPLSGLRIDPAVGPNDIRIGAITLKTNTSTHVLSVTELEPHVRAGHQIDHVRIEGDTLHFATTGEDPRFLIPLPAEISQTPRSEAWAYYALSWGAAFGMLLFAVVLADRHGVRYVGHWRRPLAMQFPRARAWTGLAIDVAATTVMILMLLRFVEAGTRFDISTLSNALDRDGVGQAVPPEVKAMKALTLRHDLQAYKLSLELSGNDERQLIFQRAAEYLYPARFSSTSRWVFALEGTPPGEAGSRCEAVDQDKQIVLYACQP